MGLSLSWTAVHGKSPEAVLAAHGLRPTGETTDDWPTRQAPFGWAQFGEWTLVFSDAFTRWSRERFVDESASAGSGPSRSPIPEQADHRFRTKPITDSGASRSLNA